ncbi:MAG TPA: trigger factor [Candidatus Marinimicrobia bacterium]|nr:trigger factor [Candidatus Neomarinimicrobiota bacterium]
MGKAKFAGFEEENRRNSVKVEIQETSQIVRQVEVSIPWADIAKDFGAHFQKYAKDLHIPGFRKGHVPRSIVQRQFGKKIQFDFFQDHFNKFYVEAIKQAMLEPVSEPKLLELSFEEGSDLNFTITVEVIPNFELPAYKDSFEISVPRYAIEDSDVEEALNKIAEQRAEMIDVEGLAEAGLTANYTELRPGEELGKAYQFEIGHSGEKRAAEEFIVGMQVGETKEVEIGGETVSLTLNSLKKKSIAEINDEFARSLGETVKDLADLKEQLRRQISSHWENEEAKARDLKIREYFINALADVEIPANLVEGYTDDMLTSMEQKYNYGLKGKAELRASLRPQALQELKWQLIKERIIDLEALEVKEEELDERIEEMLTGVESSQQESYRRYYQQKEAKNQIRFHYQEDKVMKHLFSYAKITPVDVNREQRLKGEYK